MRKVKNSKGEWEWQRTTTTIPQFNSAKQTKEIDNLVEAKRFIKTCSTPTIIRPDDNDDFILMPAPNVKAEIILIDDTI